MTRPTRFPVEEARKIIDEGIPYGPRLHPCVCGAGQHAHQGPGATGKCPATGCKRYRADLAWELAYQAADAAREDLGTALRKADRILGEKRRKENPVLPGQWRVGVSDTDTCRRAIWYRNLPPVDYQPAWEDKREAMVGTIIHEGAEARMRIVYPWREFEQDVTVPGLDRASRFDWYDPVVCTAGDTKTAGDWRWDKLGAEGPDEDTWGKVQCYGLALEEEGKPVHTVRLDYLKRSNGHDETFERPYDRATAEKYRDRLVGHASNLDILATVPDDGALRDALMPRDGDGPVRDALCKRCPARNHCWNIEAAETVGRSPYSLTILGYDPVEEAAIEAAVRRKITAAEHEKAAKAELAEVKDLLQGVEPRRFGDVEGYWTNGAAAPNWKGYAEQLQQLFTLPEAVRPALDDIPLPTSRPYSYVKWGRVRKATLAAEKKAAKAQSIPDATTEPTTAEEAS